jgi:hypothetical protein
MPSDPIFALIDRHRDAFAAPDDASFDASMGEASAIQIKLGETRPTTLAGIVAIIRYEREIRTDFPGSYLFPSDGPSDFQDRCLKPLGHPSKTLASIAFRRKRRENKMRFATHLLPFDTRAGKCGLPTCA